MRLIVVTTFLLLVLNAVCDDNSDEKTYKVLISGSSPFVYRSFDDSISSGYLPDLVSLVCNKAELKCLLFVVEDYQGLLKKVLADESSFGAADVTIEKSESVLHSNEFMHADYAIVMNKKISLDEPTPGLSTFIRIFDLKSWLFVIVCLAMTIVTLYILSNFKNEESDFKSFRNCVSLTCSTLVFMTPKIVPTTMYGKCIYLSFLFYRLIICVLFLAQAVAYISPKETLGRWEVIDSLSALLAHDQDLEFGVIRDDDFTFTFENSDYLPMNHLYKQLHSKVNHENKFNSVSEAIAKQRSAPNLVLLMRWPKALAEASNPPCDLKVIHPYDFFLQPGYGLIVNKGNPELLSKLNKAIEHLLHDGTLSALFERYWNKNDQCIDFSRRKPPKLTPLSFQPVAGATLFLFFGVLVSLLVGSIYSHLVSRGFIRKLENQPNIFSTEPLDDDLE